MVIITAKAHPILQETFEKKGFQVLYAPDMKYAELSERIAEVTGLIVTTSLKIDREILEKANKLRWIGRLGSGMELIDVEYAGSKNIVCVSSPEGNRNAVGEQCLGMLLSLLHNIAKSSFEVKKRQWKREENRGYELRGKTVGIIGFGNTGQAFAKLLAPFDIAVLAYDKYKSGFSKGQVQESDMDQIIRKADIISFHVPLTTNTKYMANDVFFSSLKNKPFIINTSRGSVIETAALINALNAGSVSGAALDVLENENIATYTKTEMEQFEFLGQHPCVIVTPHIAGYTHEAFYKMSTVLLEKLPI